MEEEDVLVGAGVILFGIGCFLFLRLASYPPEAITFWRFWGPFGIMVLGALLFCAADPFFE